MGLFGRKKAPAIDETVLAENRSRLDEFRVTKAWGVKKYETAMQFIYDEAHRWFVVVEGPEDTFREREPWVVSFDDVESVTLEVSENWSKEGGQYAPNGFGTLLQKDYKNVFWRYDMILEIETVHPQAGTIRYPMNFKTTVLQVPQHGIFVRRGLEIGGRYSGGEIVKLITKMEELMEDEAKAIQREKVLDTVTLQRPDGVMGKLYEDYLDDKYISKINNLLAHVKRAERIRTLLE